MSSIKFNDGKPLTEDEIRAAAASPIKTSMVWTDDELQANWAGAYAYYKGTAPGPTAANTSSVISTDVSDAVEWMLPSVLKPLVESPDVVRFDPVNPEDEEQAATESDYVHHTFMKRCNGFLKLYCHVKDALLLKNAVFCTYWDEGVTSRKESYENLTDIELVLLLNPADGSTVTVVSQESREEPVTDPLTGEPIPGQVQTLHSGEVRRFNPRGQPVVENCEPECFRVTMEHGSIDLTDARWCAYLMTKTRAELLAYGYAEGKIDEIPRGSARYGDNYVRYEREDVERSDNSVEGGTNETGDPSQDRFDITRVYLTLDADGDGYEEKYLVVLGGADESVLLDYYEVPENPFSASTPFIAAHKFYGYSLFDKLKRLADHKTKVLRMLEDNLDLANNPRKKVTRGQADLDDLLVSQVGGLWRVDAQDAVTEVPTPVISQQAQQLLDYYDKMRSERSGLDPNAQSISKVMPDESMNHAMERVLSMKEELVGLVIRVFAETGVKDMFIKLRNLMIRYGPKEELVKLRNKWVTINPSNWVDRTSTTIVVGLGTGDRIKKMQGLSQVFAIQQQIAQGGMMGILISPERMQHTVNEMIRTWGLGDPDDFILPGMKYLEDPRNQTTPRAQEMIRAYQLQQQQQKQAQEMEMAQQQAQAQLQQSLLQTNLQIEQMRGEAKVMEAQIKAQTADKDRMAEMQRAIEELRLQWAELRATETVNEDKLVLETAKVAVQDRKQAKEMSESDSDGDDE
jgi:hypothetical protein